MKQNYNDDIDIECPLDSQDQDDYEDDSYDDDWWDDWDICYECQGYGDDYYVNECGELECACFDCPFSDFNDDYWDD